MLKKDGTPLQAYYPIRPKVFKQGDGRQFALPLDEVADALDGVKQFRVAVNVYDVAAARWLAGPAGERAALVALYVPVMTFALWWYGLFFGMMVLGVFP